MFSKGYTRSPACCDPGWRRAGPARRSLDRVSAQLLYMDARKWPDRHHWQFPMRRLGEDGHGVWVDVPAGTVAQRGSEPPRALQYGFVGLITRDRWWIAEFYADHPYHGIYVNIGTPCEWSGDRITTIDLDLDVVLTVDGEVAVLDEDEFAANQLSYEYPRDLVVAARSATDRIVAMLEQRAEPFANAPFRWQRAAGRA